MFYFDYPFSTRGFGLFYSVPLLLIGIAIGILVAFILCVTFLRKKNEDNHHGRNRKLYNFLTMNKFYSEDIIKVLYVFTACVITFGGIAYIFRRWYIGIAIIVAGNLLARLSFELFEMFIVLVRQTTGISKKLSSIEKFYQDQDLADDWSEETAPEEYVPEEERSFAEVLDEADFSCTGVCETCQSDCDGELNEAADSESEDNEENSEINTVSMNESEKITSREETKAE